MVIDCKIIGQRIKKARQIQRISQEELADRCNLTREYISLIENGHKLPSLDTLLSLMYELNINMYEFWGHSTISKQLFDYELISLIKDSSDAEKSLYLKIIYLIKEFLDEILKGVN